MGVRAQAEIDLWQTPQHAENFVGISSQAEVSRGQRLGWESDEHSGLHWAEGGHGGCAALRMA